MNTAHNNIIESKTVLMALLAYADNDVLETHNTPDAHSRQAGLNVTLLRLATGEYAVCDKQQEGSYTTYLFDEEESAHNCFNACKEAFADDFKGDDT